MAAENKIYPVKLEQCLRLIDRAPAIICKTGSKEAMEVHNFTEMIHYGLEEILLNDMKNINSFRLLIDEFVQWKGFYGSTIHSHLCAHVRALETEIDNDLKKGETAAVICEDIRKLRLIMNVLKK